MIFNKKKGTIGITMVMLVFCLLMAFSMSYHKTLQTESLIKNNIDYSDRAADAAFSGVNYAMAVIQSNKKIFTVNNYSIAFTQNDNSSNDAGINYQSKWINLYSTATFGSYYDDDRGGDSKHHPPYRFKIACQHDNYDTVNSLFYLKAYGEYIKYDENNNIVNTYAAQLMAECYIDKNTRTIRLKRYRKMQLQNPDPDLTVANPDLKFYTFSEYGKDV